MTTIFTILIVDDDPIAQDVLQGHLLVEGYNLLVTDNGFDALRSLEKNQVDLMVLDVMMPRLDGFAVCQLVKADKRWQHIPVILITGFWEPEQMERGRKAGASDFHQKPINGVELRAQIRSLLPAQVKQSHSTRPLTLPQ